MHVCISVHTTKMTAILEKVSILIFLLAIQFFQKVELTEYLWHIFCMTIWKQWQWTQNRNGSHLEKWFPSWSFTGPSSLWTAPCRDGEAWVLKWTWEMCRRGFYSHNVCSVCLLSFDLSSLTKLDRSKERRQTKQTLWLFDRNDVHLEFLSGTHLFPKQCSLKSISA